MKKNVYGFENFHQIRNSVIANWVKENNLRMAQYLSGHRYISSTEKYRVEDLGALKEEIQKYFPLE